MMRISMQDIQKLFGGKPKSVMVAERLLHAANAEQEPRTPMQILKLVYISHGWTLGLTNRPLFGEEVEAWKYGPVVRCVYRTYADYKDNPIEQDGEDHNDEFSETERKIVDGVHSAYGQYQGLQLSAMTHKEGSPWDTAKKNGLWIIPNDIIAAYYAKRAEELRAERRTRGRGDGGEG